MTTATTIHQDATTLCEKGAKEILKQLQKLLNDKQAKQLTAQNATINHLVDTLNELTDALSDMYSPNILRFMTNKDAYIKELITSASHIQASVIPEATTAAQSVTIGTSEKEFSNQLHTVLLAFKMANHEKQRKIDLGKGDMIENTTHDIMKKYMKKNFNDVAELISPIIDALQTKG